MLYKSVSTKSPVCTFAPAPAPTLALATALKPSPANPAQQTRFAPSSERTVRVFDGHADSEKSDEDEGDDSENESEGPQSACVIGFLADPATKGTPGTLALRYQVLVDSRCGGRSRRHQLDGTIASFSKLYQCVGNDVLTLVINKITAPATAAYHRALAAIKINQEPSASDTSRFCVPEEG